MSDFQAKSGQGLFASAEDGLATAAEVGETDRRSASSSTELGDFSDDGGVETETIASEGAGEGSEELATGTVKTEEVSFHSVRSACGNTLRRNLTFFCCDWCRGKVW